VENKRHRPERRRAGAGFAIPRHIELGGIVITVELDPTLHQSKGMIGEARYAEQKIVIDPSVAPLDTTAEAYLHELCHYILFIMNENELRNNEKYVDIFAHFLYQALKRGTNGGTGQNINPDRKCPLRDSGMHQEEAPLDQQSISEPMVSRSWAYKQFCVNGSGVSVSKRPASCQRKA
jgi:hypothetical protein